MGQAFNHVLGREQKFFTAAESTAGTQVKPAATDAVEVISTTMVPNINRNPRIDARQTRDLVERMTGKSENAWSYDGYLIPSGTATTPPSVRQMIKAAMGTETIGGGDVTYSQSSGQSMPTMSLYRQFDSPAASVAKVFQEVMWGAWVDLMTISVTGGDEPKIHFEGGAFRHAQTNNSTLNGAMSASTTMLIAAADTHGMQQGSLISIGGTDNVLITVDTAAPSFTVDASVTESNGAAVVPYVPASTFQGGGGSPIAGILGTFSLGSFAWVITAFELSYQNNNKPLNDEALTQHVSDFIPQYRDVAGKLTARVRKDHIIEILKRKAFADIVLDVTLGNAAGNRFDIDAAQCEADFSEISVPEAEEATIEFPFVFKASDTSSSDALTIKHY